MKDSNTGHIDIKKIAQILWTEKEKQKTEIKNESKFERKLKAKSDEIYKSKIQEIRADGERDYYELRRQWSTKISSVLYAMVLFQYFILIGVAFGIVFEMFIFEEAKPLLLLIAGENFVQILGLAYIIVKFLYPINKKN
ncbi:MAG: hypothetical protein N4A38_05215 [Candidatus Gracilibacteria bacterium]|nr:hypothetical protein [Candidatus Gracilibacteria bacterium]